MAGKYEQAIKASGLSIYHSQDDYPELFIPNEELETMLGTKIIGQRLKYPLRTRSKVLKTLVCEAIGYPVPASFKKTQPRFPGQNFDTYVQKANNLQIWNEDVSPSRRYVLVRLDASDYVIKIRVVSGEVLAELDTTGTLTQKFQARSQFPVNQSVSVSYHDTDIVQEIIRTRSRFPQLMPIVDVFERLKSLVGSTVSNVGMDQERNRGGELHRKISRCLDVPIHADSGQFPDVIDQLLEVKLQTSPTIDLGLVSPDGTGGVSDIPELRHCDMRYAVFYGSVIGSDVRLEHVVVSTGQDFFTFFQRFGGLVLNKKIQIPLPARFFD